MILLTLFSFFSQFQDVTYFRLMRKVIHSFSRSFSSDSSSGEIRQNEKDRSDTRLYRGILDNDWSMGRPMKREETNVKFFF